MAQREITVKKNLLFGGRTLLCNLEFALQPKENLELAQFCLRELLPKEIFFGERIKNYKGRDRLNTIASDWPQELLPEKDELFFALAAWTEKPSGARHTLRINLYTEFESFGPDAVFQLVRPELSGALPTGSSLRLWPAFPGIEIFYWRLGLDFFKARLFAGIFSLAPAVCETLLLESLNGQLLVRLDSSRLRATGEFPFADFDIISPLSQAIEKIADFNLGKEIKIKLEQL